MSGILDNKSRIIDAIITYEGKMQMAAESFQVKYVSFSDTFLDYQPDLENGHVDPTSKIYLESFNIPHDQVIFEADDSGNLIPFRQHGTVSAVETLTGSLTSSVSWTSFVNGNLVSRLQTYSTASNISGNYSDFQIKGSDFSSQIEGLLTSSIDNFQKIRMIGSIDPIFGEKDFAISPTEIQFKISPNAETIQMIPSTNINTIDSLFSDEKLRNLDNFKYLPPIKKSSYAVDKTDVTFLESQGFFLGNYPPWGPIEKLTMDDIQLELDRYDKIYPSKTITFDPTSRENNLVSQFFEVVNNQVKKLDVIDYGKVTDNSTNMVSSHHVFFVGKVLVDDNGSDTFIHLFTLVFTDEDQ